MSDIKKTGQGQIPKPTEQKNTPKPKEKIPLNFSDEAADNLLMSIFGTKDLHAPIEGAKKTKQTKEAPATTKKLEDIALNSNELDDLGIDSKELDEMAVDFGESIQAMQSLEAKMEKHGNNFDPNKHLNAAELKIYLQDIQDIKDMQATTANEPKTTKAKQETTNKTDKKGTTKNSEAKDSKAKAKSKSTKPKKEIRVIPDKLAKKEILEKNVRAIEKQIKHLGNCIEIQGIMIGIGQDKFDPKEHLSDELRPYYDAEIKNLEAKKLAAKISKTNKEKETCEPTISKKRKDKTPKEIFYSGGFYERRNKAKEDLEFAIHLTLLSDIRAHNARVREIRDIGSNLITFLSHLRGFISSLNTIKTQASLKASTTPSRNYRDEPQKDLRAKFDRDLYKIRISEAQSTLRKIIEEINSNSKQIEIRTNFILENVKGSSEKEIRDLQEGMNPFKAFLNSNQTMNFLLELPKINQLGAKAIVQRVNNFMTKFAKEVEQVTSKITFLGSDVLFLKNIDSIIDDIDAPLREATRIINPKLIFKEIADYSPDKDSKLSVDKKLQLSRIVTSIKMFEVKAPDQRQSISNALLAIVHNDKSYSGLYQPQLDMGYARYAEQLVDQLKQPQYRTESEELLANTSSRVTAMEEIKNWTLEVLRDNDVRTDSETFEEVLVKEKLTSLLKRYLYHLVSVKKQGEGNFDNYDRARLGTIGRALLLLAEKEGIDPLNVHKMQELYLNL